jgi:hypothetical protein
MPFDDFWHVDQKADHIFALKKGKYEEGLSDSEKLILGLWRAHFNGTGEYLTRFNMRSFDETRRQQVLYFLSIAPEFSFE